MLQMGMAVNKRMTLAEASARIYINEALEILAVTIDELRVLKNPIGVRQ